MKSPLLLSLIAAAAWGVWPVLARMSKASPIYINFSVSFFTTITIIFYFYIRDHSISGIGNTLRSGNVSEILLPIAAGMFNAIGIIIYGYILSAQNSNGIQVTQYAPIATGAIPVFTLIVGLLLLKDEYFSLNKIIGMLAIILGVYFLNKK